MEGLSLRNSYVDFFPMQKAATIFPGFSVFLGIVDNPGLDQIHQAIAEKFGMHPEMSLVEQVGENRVRKTSITHLDRVAVLNKPGHIVADALGRLICAIPGSSRRGSS